MNYRPLIAGEVRQKGDQVKSRYKLAPSSCVLVEDGFPTWRGVTLVGHSILHSDLVHLELRRPIV